VHDQSPERNRTGKNNSVVLKLGALGSRPKFHDRGANFSILGTDTVRLQDEAAMDETNRQPSERAVLRAYISRAELAERLVPAVPADGAAEPLPGLRLN